MGMGDAPQKAPTFMGVPMKHISLITVRMSLLKVAIDYGANICQLTFQNSALILVSTPDFLHKTPKPEHGRT
jgi:hypothetical protein